MAGSACAPERVVKTSRSSVCVSVTPGRSEAPRRAGTAALSRLASAALSYKTQPPTTITHKQRRRVHRFNGHFLPFLMATVLLIQDSTFLPALSLVRLTFSVPSQPTSRGASAG